MLKVELTKNYGGFKVSGDYKDLNYLYDAICYFIDKDAENIREDCMRNHLFGFLYDVRHAYQGQREAELVNNELEDYTREWNNIKKKDVTDKNIYYYFNYFLPDLILDMLLIKHFINKKDRKENNELNQYLNFVNYFYSIVLDSLDGFLTKIQFNKVKKGILNGFVLDTLFVPQWFENLSIDYINMTREQREKEIMHILKYIYDFMEYQDYYDMKKSIEKYCEENDCLICDVKISNHEYPNEIDW